MKFAVVVWCCATFAVISGSPPETHGFIPDFHESTEMTVTFEQHAVKNGDSLPLSMIAFEPTFGPMCGADKTKNYTLVMVDTNDIGSPQRAMMIVGNMPAGAGGTVKLGYLAPTLEQIKQQTTHHVYILALFEMDHFSPRFLPGDCTTNFGQKLLVPECAPDVPKKDCPRSSYVPDDNCRAWKELPMHHQRNDFNAVSFATANNLTIIDILWFQLAPLTETEQNNLVNTNRAPTTKLALNVLSQTDERPPTVVQPKVSGSVETNPQPETVTEERNLEVVVKS
jgi:hypothetical protein